MGGSRCPRCLESAHAEQLGQDFGPFGAFGLPSDVLDVRVDGGCRDAQPVGDLGGVHSVQHEPQHVEFAQRQAVTLRRVGKQIARFDVFDEERVKTSGAAAERCGANDRRGRDQRENFILFTGFDLGNELCR